MINVDEVVTYLNKRYVTNSIIIVKGFKSLSSSLDIFGNARIIIGIHGGAFYNLMLAPSSANIVEILPVTKEGDITPDSLAYNIIWKMATMLGQTYWRMSEHSDNKFGNLFVNVTKLGHILDQIDSQ